jgi:hypothetical protein
VRTNVTKLSCARNGILATCGAWNFGDGCVRVISLGFDFDFETNDVFGHYSYGEQLCSAF